MPRKSVQKWIFPIFEWAQGPKFSVKNSENRFLMFSVVVLSMHFDILIKIVTILAKKSSKNRFRCKHGISPKTFWAPEFVNFQIWEKIFRQIIFDLKWNKISEMKTFSRLQVSQAVWFLQIVSLKERAVWYSLWKYTFWYYSRQFYYNI